MTGVLQATEPRFWYVPDGAVFTIADEIADFMEDLGFQVDEPERLACRALYATDRTGDWIGLESCVISARQNIKTTVMLAGAMYDTFVDGVAPVNWTAHEFKTSSATFTEMQNLIESHSWLSREVKRIRTANGKEGFDLTNGASLNVLARTKKSGRGMAAPRLYGDEGLFWTAQQLGALVPTMSAQVNPHLVHGSSPGIPTSAPLRALRDRGRSGEDPYLGYVEWSSDRQPCLRVDCSHEPGSVGCQLDNEELWPHGNPALGRRITYEYIRQERLTLPVGEFMRERLAWWEDPPTAVEGQVFPAEAWAERLDADSVVPDDAPVAFVVDTSWDRQTSWISVAGLRPDGQVHVQVVAQNFGTDWVVPWLSERKTRRTITAVGLQGSGAPVSSLLEPLKEKLGEDLVKPLSVQELGRASGMFYDAVLKGGVVHIGQEQLDSAIRQLAIRPIGDSWVPDRKASPVDIAPLVAGIEAMYLLLTTPEPAKPEAYAPRRLRR